MQPPNRCLQWILAFFVVQVSVPIMASAQKDLASDVISAQSHMATFMREATKLNSLLRQLYAIGSYDFSYSVLHICDFLTSLQVPQEDIDFIKSDAGLLETSAGPDVNGLRDTVDYLNQTLTGLNREFINLNSTNRFTLQELHDKFNSNLTSVENYYSAVLSAMLANGQIVENNVREATENLSGPEIAQIYELIGRYKAKFGTKEAEVKQSKEIFTAVAGATDQAISTVIEQIANVQKFEQLENFQFSFDPLEF